MKTDGDSFKFQCPETSKSELSPHFPVWNFCVKLVFFYTALVSGAGVSKNIPSACNNFLTRSIFCARKH